MSAQEDRFEQALQHLAELQGAEGAERLRETARRGYRTPALKDFAELTIAHGFVDMWSRAGLDMLG
ncbi:MAG: hypothetical protein AB7L13_12405 [Acidimicrobiia bacterium]